MSAHAVQLRRRLAVGLLGALLGGAALLNGTPTAASDFSAGGNIESTGRIGTTSGQFDGNGDSESDRGEIVAVLPLPTVTTAALPTTASVQTIAQLSATFPTVTSDGGNDTDAP